ncbi:hypothetical protein PEB0149_011230 [Bartonella apis]|uniref:Uncharacterized protein n=1 Tax=Bartonella apis TaxID=1686310 RepID=A0A1R0F9Q7_9HYPH|nr:hypothetical protein PEB0149_011230 [Bartonella apis]
MTVQQIVRVIIFLSTPRYKKPRSRPVRENFQPIAFLQSACPAITRAPLTGFDLSRIFTLKPDYFGLNKETVLKKHCNQQHLCLMQILLNRTSSPFQLRSLLLPNH